MIGSRTFIVTMSKNSLMWASRIRTWSETLSAYALYMPFTESKDLYAVRAASISILEYTNGEFLLSPFLCGFTNSSFTILSRIAGLCPRVLSQLCTSLCFILSEVGERLFSAASAPSIAASMRRFFNSKSYILILMAIFAFFVTHIRIPLTQPL